MLIIFSGLPGSGKTTLAKKLAQKINGIYLRIDTIEQALRNSINENYFIDEQGYKVGFALAAENLRLGFFVIADSVNPIKLSRDEWQNVAISEQKNFLNIEIICSDPIEHQKRVEQRTSDILGLKQPSWNSVLKRYY